ncbi:hypothetical protein DUT91_01215 [Phyllobacterium salinisoli]|uniref:Aminoglycoside phosphotransferase n=1 Tax=Phyllobacterium salinisoli TaxID=1899321 RepID=A0A368K8A4_9HYPH|nr:hypothetical protein [Phyllobacterium salinisoli]RCS25454.1 hypothetical protein DUT91_01215 [Phyllobacterium salinisoli]
MANNGAKRGFFRAAMDNLVAARSRQAARYVNGALLSMDDETLKANGYSREGLKRGGSAYYPF